MNIEEEIARLKEENKRIALEELPVPIERKPLGNILEQVSLECLQCLKKPRSCKLLRYLLIESPNNNRLTLLTCYDKEIQSPTKLNNGWKLIDLIDAVDE